MSFVGTREISLGGVICWVFSRCLRGVKMTAVSDGHSPFEISHFLERGYWNSMLRFKPEEIDSISSWQLWPWVNVVLDPTDEGLLSSEEDLASLRTALGDEPDLQQQFFEDMRLQWNAKTCTLAWRGRTALNVYLVPLEHPHEWRCELWQLEFLRAQTGNTIHKV
eukprot:4238604-Amphidinium_carterae.4